MILDLFSGLLITKAHNILKLYSCYCCYRIAVTSKQFNRQVLESVIYRAAVIYQREPHKFKHHSGNLKEKGSAPDVIKG